MPTRWAAPSACSTSSVDAYRVVDRQGSVGGDAVGERTALDELHDEVEEAVGVAGVEDGDGVGMGERRRGTGLADEASPRRVIGRGPGVEQLDGDRPAQAQVAGGAHLRHPAATQLLAERIAPGDHLLHGRNARSSRPPIRRGTLPS